MGCHGGEEEVGQGVGDHSEQLEGWEQEVGCMIDDSERVNA